MGMLRAGLDAESYDRAYTNEDLVGRLASYFRPWLKRFTIIVISVTLLSAAQAGVPILAARGVEMLAGDAQGADVSQFLLYVLVGALIVLGVAVWGINWVRRLLTSMLIGDVVLALRKDAFRAAVKEAEFESVRGDFRFGNNNHPIQDIYVREVVKEGDVLTNKIVGTAFEDHQDAYAAECKM